MGSLITSTNFQCSRYCLGSTGYGYRGHTGANVGRVPQLNEHLVTRSARALVLAPHHAHPERMPRWLWVLIILLLIFVFILPSPEAAGDFFGDLINSIGIFFRSFADSLSDL
jgi:hypothetical protein